MHTEVILSSDVIFELKTIKSFLILEFDRDNVINAYLDHAKLNFLHWHVKICTSPDGTALIDVRAAV